MSDKIVKVSRRTLLSGAAGAAALTVTPRLFSPAIAQNAPLKVGLMLPFSGTFAALGENITAAFELYVKEQGGKLGGRGVTLVRLDDESDPSKAPANVNRLLGRDIALMAAALAVCALFIIGTTWFAVDQPWLGLRLAPDDAGARIVAVDPAGANSHLRANERLIAIGGLPIVAEDLIEEPDNFETYAALDAFFERYLAEGETKGLGFLEWVETVYDAEALEREFKPSFWSDLLVDRVMRRE